MVKRKLRRRSKSRRRRKRFRRSRRNSYDMRRPLGSKLKMHTRYVETLLTVNPGVGGLASEYIFSANGLYDPNITGAGHQPIGFDQLMLMYNHYTVIGARMALSYRNTDASYGAIMGIYVSAASSVSYDITEQLENGNMAYQIAGAVGEGKCAGTITKNVSIGKFMGRKSILSEDDFRGSISANPAEEVYFHIVAQPLGSIDTSAIRLFVRIDYVAILTEPKQLGQS